jgi:hypothetical protein
MVNGSILQLVAIHYILYAYVDFQRAVALARILVFFSNTVIWNGLIMPLVRRDVYLVAVGNWASELNFGAVDIVAAVQVVVTHPLQNVLKMALVWLEHAVHDSALMQQVRKSRHVQWVEHVHLEEHLVSNTVSKEWHAFDERDVTDIDRLSIVRIAAVGGSEGMVYRGAKGDDVCIDYSPSAPGPTTVSHDLPTSFSRLPVYSKYR